MGCDKKGCELQGNLGKADSQKNVESVANDMSKDATGINGVTNTLSKNELDKVCSITKGEYSKTLEGECITVLSGRSKRNNGRVLMGLEKGMKMRGLLSILLTGGNDWCLEY